MSLLSAYLRAGQGNSLSFWCPGCNSAHMIQYGEGSGPRWGWNGDEVRPTFTPSINVLGIKHDMTDAEQVAYDAAFDEVGPMALLDDPRFRTVCHSFVRDGRINFLGDSTHSLAGQTVDLPPWPGQQID